ncbi:N-acyl-D-glucosamine 2-epimerase, partial [Bacteroides uniformis]|nr:N-acyl-D-glucosamine 2-epimerase [Bacteroides uniformis]
MDIIMRMRQEMEEELVSNILPFWINRMTDEVNGGFYGRITGREEVKPEAEKGAILN